MGAIATIDPGPQRDVTEHQPHTGDAMHAVQFVRDVQLINGSVVMIEPLPTDRTPSA